MVISFEIQLISIINLSSPKLPPDLSEQVQNSYPIVLDNVECTADGQCSYATEPNCKHSEDIFIYCGSEEQCNQAAFSFYTVDAEGVKTTNGSGLLIASRSLHAGVGVLKVRNI